jgi:hypothetical protein
MHAHTEFQNVTMTTMATHAKTIQSYSLFHKGDDNNNNNTFFQLKLSNKFGSSFAMPFAPSQQVKNHQTIKTRNVP